jgi:hypothetical protein
MRDIHQTRALLLSFSLLILIPWSTAQNGPLPETNRIVEPKSEPITIPAGTHLLMKLISPLHTTSSTPGSGVYLETAFPVVASDHVAIPEHTRVMGVVANARRPGRVKGRSQMRLRFTQLILPDNRELSIVGNLQSLPGSSKNRTVNHEGTIEPVDQIDADVYTMAKTTGIGALGGAISRAGPAWIGYGALIGGGLGLAKVLFTRGDEISLPVGTRVEMVLQHPLTVQTPTLPAVTDSGETTKSNPSIPMEHATNQARANVPSCLRDGRTLECVP